MIKKTLSILSGFLFTQAFRFSYFFSRSLISVRRVWSFVGAGGAAGAASSFFLAALMAFISIKTTNARIRKSINTWIKLP
jgi:hypothetical protein